MSTADRRKAKIVALNTAAKVLGNVNGNVGGLTFSFEGNRFFSLRDKELIRQEMDAIISSLDKRKARLEHGTDGS